MKQKLKSTTKENLLRTTLNLIASESGANNVNLREVARRAGCSAPNIYNYFKNLDDLLNQSLLLIYDDFGNKMSNLGLSSTDSEKLYISMLQGYIGYALENPGWFNFCYYEKVNYVFHEMTKLAGENVGKMMYGLLNSITNFKISAEEIQELGQILNMHIVGELSEVITGRKQVPDNNIFMNGIIDRSIKILNAFKKSFKGESYETTE